MGLFSKITRSVTKPLKKVLKSPLGKIALGIGAYKFGPKMWGSQLGGEGGWGAGWDKFAPWLLGTPETPGIRPGHPAYKAATGNLWQRMGPLGKAATVCIGTAAGAKMIAPELEEKIDIDVDDPTGHANY